ncbi:hypothetical protein DVA67_002645 [Solirubrobacter sp. CPCC 204708]|uniref:Polymorphic toxin type 4 domain-containing protein n=1 Tax=Solirubrobacter deserti TaxID=2282478 RepID=A0ABT4RR69_9ACTN|nr:polymorphic toxin type 4 domain-containing protein [Solirubrobacter deserti]MBE2314860.1 hypothetical protein [Solirubrobacter deserti]MDA0141087.1 polymorphic toxin type 4 domain-containing protein [Solirubrobacter deserti]
MLTNPARQPAAAPEAPSRGAGPAAAPLSRGLSPSAVLALQRTAGNRATTRALGGGGSAVTAAFVLAFLDGARDQLVAEELHAQRASRLGARLPELFSSPSNLLRFQFGWNKGFAHGLVSPVTDLFEVMLLGADLNRRLTQWVITSGVEVMTCDRARVLAQAQTVAVRAALLDAALRHALDDVLKNPVEAVRVLQSLGDQLTTGAAGMANRLGREAVSGAFEVAEQDWPVLGGQLGRIAGTIAVEIVLAAVSDGLAPLVHAGVAAVGRLGRAGRGLLAAVEVIARALRELARAAARARPYLARSFRPVWAALDPLFEEAEALVRMISDGVPGDGLAFASAGGPGVPSPPGSWPASKGGGAVLAETVGPDGATIIRGPVGPPLGRKYLERLLPPSVEVDLKGWERAHSRGNNLGTESAAGIRYAPPKVNQELQRLGVEDHIAGLYGQRADGVEVILTTVTRSHPGTLRLASIEYEVTLVRDGKSLRAYGASITVGRDDPTRVAADAWDVATAVMEADGWLK